MFFWVVTGGCLGRIVLAPRADALCANIAGMDRRHFLQAGVFTAGGTATLPLMASAVGAQAAGVSPYGSLEGLDPDENGIVLPAGFSSRVIAVAGEPVGDTGYEWPIFPDGAAVFDDGAGGWIHTVNSEVFVEGAAGVSAVHFDAEGEVIDAYAILRGSIANCGGGPTPWAFLSGEESARRRLPLGMRRGVARRSRCDGHLRSRSCGGRSRAATGLRGGTVRRRLYRYAYPDLTPAARGLCDQRRRIGGLDRSARSSVGDPGSNRSRPQRPWR